MVAEMVDTFSDPGEDFYFFGHSLGGLLAFEFYQALRKAGHRLPSGLVLSGCSAPTLSPSDQNLHLRPAAQMIDAVLMNYPDERGTEERRRALQATKKLLRADIQMLETYPGSKSCLVSPLIVLAGRQDPVAPPAQVRPWLQLADNNCALHYFAGGHDFIHHHWDEVAGLIASMSPTPIVNVAETV
jgi:surfactin synthase thioesterase subunit